MDKEIIEKINETLDMIEKEDKIVSLYWSIYKGFPLELFANTLTAYIPYTIYDIKNALMSNNKKLYERCLSISINGSKYISTNYLDVAIGGSSRTIKKHIDENGVESHSIINKAMSEKVREKLFNQSKDEKYVLVNKSDRDDMAKYFKSSEEKYIINPRVLDKQIQKLYPQQYSIFYDFVEYLEGDNEEPYVLLMRSSYQAGKTTLMSVMVGYLLNFLANCSREDLSADMILMASTRSSLQRNVLQRIANFDPDNIKIPYLKSDVWDVGHNIKLWLLTHGKIGVPQIKGCSSSIIIYDEGDLMHEDMLNIMTSRFTRCFHNKNGKKKKIIISTSNPLYPEHPIEVFIEGFREKGAKVINLSSFENRSLPKSYFEMQERIFGGKDTGLYKRYVLGIPCHISSGGAVFTIVEDKLFFPINFDEIHLDSDPIDRIKYKTYHTCNIGFDIGTSSQFVIICSFIYNYNGMEYVDTLHELVYEENFDRKIVQSTSLDNLNKIKADDFIYIVNKCSKYCNNINAILPHDAYSQKLFYDNVIKTNYLNCTIRNTNKAKTIYEGIELIRILINTNRIRISNTCKHLKQQLYTYEYSYKKLHDTHEEVIDPSCKDHATDAFRYSIIYSYDILAQERFNIEY